MPVILTFVASLLFGLGLIVSGLANPAKVQNFLDLAGQWDPSLIFTMAGAIATTALGFQLVLGRSAPLFSDAFHLPQASAIDRKLLGGAALFGIGWGLVGYCPGPAIVALSLGGASALTFVIAMLAGMALGRKVG